MSRLSKNVKLSNSLHWRLAKKASGRNDRLKHDYHIAVSTIQGNHNAIVPRHERKYFLNSLRNRYKSENKLKFEPISKDSVLQQYL